MSRNGVVLDRTRRTGLDPCLSDPAAAAAGVGFATELLLYATLGNYFATDRRGGSSDQTDLA